MKVLVAISIDLGDEIEGMADKVLAVVNHIEPTTIPGFADEVRIVTPDFYDEVVGFLDKDLSNDS